jgi:Uma2 family endonuclease
MGAVMATTRRFERATEENWMYPPAEGWTFDQVKDLDLPFDWLLVDGVVVVRGQTKYWHNIVRDEVADHLKQARTKPYRVVTEQCVMYDEYNTPKPDVIVFDPTGLELFDLECVPVQKLALVVEVVSPGSRTDDRFTKPALFSDALVPTYWRIERERDGRLALYEYRLDTETRSYAPPQAHHDRFITELPFAVEIDLQALLDL